MHGDDPTAHASRLAHHFSQAAPVAGTEKLVRYSLLAGEQALAAHAWEEALEHFQRGLEAKEGQPMNSETADLWFGLGRAQAATRELFQFQECLSSLRQAFDYYGKAGDVDRAVLVAEYPVLAALGVKVGSAELVSHALRLVPPDSHQTGRLLSTYGLSLYQETGDYEVAQAAFQQALSIAQQVGDQGLEMRTRANATNVDFHHLRWSEVLQRGRAAINMALFADDPQAEVGAHLYMMRVLGYMGDPQGARLHTAPMLQVAEGLRHRSWLGTIMQSSSTLCQYEGNWTGARAFLDQALAVEPHEPRHLCIRAVLEHQAGDLAQGEFYLGRLLEVVHCSPMGAGFA